MKALIAALVSGMLFAVGLAVSGMTQPSKVIGFLDFLGDWDPSLALVMGGALVVYGISHRLILKRKTPLLSPRFLIPTRRDLDGRLLGGAALFGVGWGLAGYCPGPGLTSLGTGTSTALVFVAGMLAGMLAFRVADAAVARRRRQADRNRGELEAHSLGLSPNRNLPTDG